MKFPNSEQVYRVFRGSSELAKALRQAALRTEVTAAAIAAWRTMRPNLDWPGWASLGLAGFVLLGFALRLWAKTISGYSERCRRMAVRAYGSGVDVSFATASIVKADAPPSWSTLPPACPRRI